MDCRVVVAGEELCGDEEAPDRDDGAGRPGGLRVAAVPEGGEEVLRVEC